jgi:glycerol uptake facilitator-like aquaporin
MVAAHLLLLASCCCCCCPAVSAFGGASGAHLNPAVSLMLLLRGKISSGKAIAYMVAQVGKQGMGAHGEGEGCLPSQH